MHDRPDDGLRPSGFELRGGHAERLATVRDVVDNNARLPVHFPDEVHLRRLVGAAALPGEDGQWRVELLCERRRALRAPDVGRHHHQIVGADASLLHEALDLLGQERQRVHVVDRVGGKALDLRDVQLDGQDSVCPGHLQQVRHEPGGDWRAALLLRALTRVAIQRHDRRHAICRSTADGVEHDQQLHEVLLRASSAVARRLDHEHVAIPDGLVDHHIDLPALEALDRGVAERHSHLRRDVLGELRVRIA
mmetsp:Transcript_118011/g.330458  ORF Transcript_118011/g.330458 Transcript_118011/m.330458 type:complete len:250 (+) Transcript_118011:283-1032(+)